MSKESIESFDGISSLVCFDSVFQTPVQDAEWLLLPIFCVLRNTSVTRLGRVIVSLSLVMFRSGGAVHGTFPRDSASSGA